MDFRVRVFTSTKQSVSPSQATMSSSPFRREFRQFLATTVYPNPRKWKYVISSPLLPTLRCSAFADGDDDLPRSALPAQSSEASNRRVKPPELIPEL
jgi:hypothetical protein